MACQARLFGVRVYNIDSPPNVVGVLAPAVTICAADIDSEWEPTEETTLTPPVSVQVHEKSEEG